MSLGGAGYPFTTYVTGFERGFEILLNRSVFGNPEGFYLADYVVRLDLAVVGLVVASAVVTFVVDWVGQSRVQAGFRWRHWWHWLMLSAATLLVGVGAGFAIDFITYRVFGVWAVWGLSSVGLLALWIVSFGLIHFVWSAAQLRHWSVVAPQ